MRLATISERFRAASAYRAVRRSLVDGDRARASNLTGSSKAVLAAAISDDLDAPLVIITETAERAEVLATDLEALLGEDRVGLLPQWEVLPYERRAPQREIEGQRLEFLLGLLDGSIAVGVASLRAIVQKVVAPADLDARIIRLAVGDSIERDSLQRRLVEMGFERESMVSEVGTFSVRGGIVDVFGYRYENPVRIEFVDDEVGSIRLFDLATQRSVAAVDRVEVLPARERPAIDPVRPPLPRVRMEAIPAYFHPDTVVAFDEPDRISILHDELTADVTRRFNDARAERDDVAPPPELYLDAVALESSVAPFRRLDLLSLHMRGGPPPPPIRFETRAPDPVGRSVPRLVSLLRERVAEGVQAIILCDNLGQLERLTELLPRDLDTVVLEVGALAEGFEAPDVGLAVYTDHEIFARRRRPRRRRRYASASTQIHLAEITPGDFLVHLDYGVGQYAGLERLALADAAEVEALRLEYADAEVLYVPVEQIARIERFTGPEGTTPTLHRLSGTRWERQKERTRAAIEALTEELLQLHAERELVEGFAFGPDTTWQREMEASFVYEDTPDQRAAAEAVKRDLERPRPMDRLVCGDVGYGKTEVAIRAAFKAVQDGKQVAVLTPTTVLAAQHQDTFGERLADFPVEIGALSRFNTAAETRETVRRVANGTIDIVIGTHRLLSGDVTFSDLGLVIIDEEQRFGVKLKERLRALKTSVDVLTLSATPIPRTLQMSLMGVREMSLIETPPPNRTPIVTWVAEYDEGLIEDAIRREVDRGGQVFFVHNRVQTIEAARRQIARLVPELRIEVAHGQLPERALEEVMMRFFQGGTDVLVTSAIIESGLDVPNANTILIDRADRFGLADLYQLRGRVGRSYHRAYCYMLTPARQAMTREAEQRLKVIEEHADLGAGYQIALHDLEMRGAGDLLGANQSGFIATVGFETYLRLLDETVAELKGTPDATTKATELAFDADAYLPSTYIPDDQQKLALYRRLSRLRDIEAVDDLERELIDRYGPMPDPARHLCSAARLKLLATAAGLDRLRVNPRRARAELRWPAGVEPRLRAIQAAAGEQVEVTVRQVEPLHLELVAPDDAGLTEALVTGLRAWVPKPIVTG